MLASRSPTPPGSSTTTDDQRGRPRQHLGIARRIEHELLTTGHAAQLDVIADRAPPAKIAVVAEGPARLVGREPAGETPLAPGGPGPGQAQRVVIALEHAGA